MRYRREVLHIQSEQRQSALVISLSGSFDALTADQAHSFISTQLDHGQQQIALDLGHVDFMSSAGIRVLLDMLKRSRGMGGDLRLAATQPGVQRTLEISGMVRVLKVYPSVEEVVRSYGPQES
jgi:anti-anti-sigma factor